MFAGLISEKKTPKVRDAQNFMKNAKSQGILTQGVRERLLGRLAWRKIA